MNMALQKIKPLDDFLFGARVYDAVKETADDEFVIHPADNFIACALAMGAPLGNWSTVKDHFADAGTVMPVGARVIGSNGKIYQVAPGSDGMADPVAGGAGWADVSNGVGDPANGISATTFISDAPPAAGKVKKGDVWMTGSTTTAPYPKDCKMYWNGTSWVLEAGNAFSEFQFSIPNVGPDSGTFAAVEAILPIQANAMNNLNVSGVGNKITIAADGHYTINYGIEVGSVIRINDLPDYRNYGHEIYLLHNGNKVSGWQNQDTTEADFTALTLGVQTDDVWDGANLKAGDTLQLMAIGANAKLDGTAHIKVRRVA